MGTLASVSAPQFTRDFPLRNVLAGRKQGKVEEPRLENISLS